MPRLLGCKEVVESFVQHVARTLPPCSKMILVIVIGINDMTAITLLPRQSTPVKARLSTKMNPKMPQRTSPSQARGQGNLALIPPKRTKRLRGYAFAHCCFAPTLPCGEWGGIFPESHPGPLVVTLFARCILCLLVCCIPRFVHQSVLSVCMLLLRACAHFLMNHAPNL